MPIKDIDGGLVWQGYNPRLFNDKLPQEQYVSKPFYFGQSQVPTSLGLSKSQYSGTGITKCSCRLKKLRKLPNIRK